MSGSVYRTRLGSPVATTLAERRTGRPGAVFVGRVPVGTLPHSGARA